MRRLPPLGNLAVYSAPQIPAPGDGRL